MKKIVAIASVMALFGLASNAFAADRLTVKDSSSTTTFSVDETGKLNGKAGIEMTDYATGNPLFFVHPTTGRIAVGNNTPNAAIWLKGNVANNIQVVSGYTGTTTTSGGGGFVVTHNNAAGAYAASGDRLGYMYFGSFASNGTTNRVGGGISAGAEAAFTDTSAPTFFKFETASTSTTSTARTERLRITANGNIVAGNKGGDPTAAAMTTTVTDGFLYIPTVAGALTSCGSVTNYNGHVPIWFDSTNVKVCTCSAGTLKCTAVMN